MATTALPRLPQTARTAHTAEEGDDATNTSTPRRRGRHSRTARRPDIADDDVPWVKTHPLEGDGLLSGLYQHLYKKDKHFQSGKVRIPDTVVYEHNFPRGWYSYDAKAQEMLKRVGKDLDTSTIYQRFSKCPSRSGSPDTVDICAKFIHTSVDEITHDARTTVEFLTPADLFHFLNERKQRPDGILQKFILPKSKYNNQIQAVWSPRVCIVQRRENVSAINDRYIPAFERCVTFDGPTHYTEEGFCAPKTKEQIKSICESIVAHVQHIEHKTISRMVLYFKVDRNDNVWLLWCSSLRMMGNKNAHTPRVPLDLSPSFSSPTINEATARRSKEWARALEESDRKQFDLSHDPMFAKTISPRGHFLRSPTSTKSRTLPADFKHTAFGQHSRREAAEEPAAPVGPPKWEVEAEREFASHPRLMREYTGLCGTMTDVQSAFEDLMYGAYSHQLRTTTAPGSPRERTPFVVPLPECLERLSSAELTSIATQLRMNIRDETVEDGSSGGTSGAHANRHGSFGRFGNPNSGLMMEIDPLWIPLNQINTHISELVMGLKEQRVGEIRRRTTEILNAPPTPEPWMGEGRQQSVSLDDMDTMDALKHQPNPAEETGLVDQGTE